MMQGDASEMKRRLGAAQGYLDLGMEEDAWNELETIEVDDLPRRRDKAMYLELVLELAVRSSDWELGAQIAGALRIVSPDHAGAVMHGAYCLHELGRTNEARAWLLGGPEALLGHPLFHYNLGCYHAVLGDMEDALACVREAVALDPALRDTARRDPDLQPLRDMVE